MKRAQGTIKILMKSDFSSDLTPFLTIMGAQPNMGRLSPRLLGLALPSRYIDPVSMGKYGYEQLS